jgi:2-amino-4-hydroxy-6-hydroxymethyldihydropteridine diphosphokinase / dihydropteroate synthase
MDFTCERTVGMQIYLGLGSNLGDRREHLATAVRALAARRIAVDRVSPVVESPAMLPDDAPAEWNQPFLNLVVACRTQDSPVEVLASLKAIERELGRAATARWAPRPIDIDILLWGEATIATEELTVPHAGLAERAFVLAPLAALAPRLTIPGLGGATVLERSQRHGQHIPLWMGIVNVTPDSFSDGGAFVDGPTVDTHVDRLLEAGAEIIDIGAESTRPGATPLDADTEWRRLEPVLGALLEKHRRATLGPQFSVDTYHPETARRAIDLGVDIINDVSGLTTRAMVELAAMSNRDFIAMHNLGVPADPARVLPLGSDPGASIEHWLDERLGEWQRAGLDVGRIVFDPGIGFGKNPLQSLKVLRDMRRFERFGLRCVVGHSRKSFMHRFAAAGNEDRDLFTIGASLSLCQQGVDILRVHNVAAHVAAYRGWAHLH